MKRTIYENQESAGIAIATLVNVASLHQPAGVEAPSPARGMINTVRASPAGCSQHLVVRTLPITKATGSISLAAENPAP